MTRSVTILICCLCLNVHAQSGQQTEAADSIAYEEYITALGRAFFEGNDFEKVLATYEQADTASMTEHDLCLYSMAAFFKKQYPKALDIARYAMQQGCRDIHLTRIAFFCTTELQQYDAARQYADSLCANATTPLNYYDYDYLARYLSAKPHPTDNDQTLLKQSYAILINHYLNEADDDKKTADSDDKQATDDKLTARNKALARHYAEKLLAIDPHSPRARQTLEK